MVRVLWSKVLKQHGFVRERDGLVKKARYGPKAKMRRIGRGEEGTYIYTIHHDRSMSRIKVAYSVRHWKCGSNALFVRAKLNFYDESRR